MFYRTDDVRIEDLRPLIPPAILMEELPLLEQGSAVVAQAREAVSRILRGEDDRLVLIVGPCSIHDPIAGLDYAKRLQKEAEQHQGELCVVMRVYFEKPRTTVGWKGLINDPHLDGSFVINEGLRAARRFLLDVTEVGLPAGTEFLDPITPQFIADLVSWGAIGARTTESQVHRELASGLSTPVGFKNGTDGTVQIAVDAIRSSAHPHHFLSVTKQSVAAIVETKGNCPSPSRAWRRSSRPRATRTATSSCEAAPAAPTTRRSGSPRSPGSSSSPASGRAS
jgi:3-deoxy-7-phosphoheptulonate synthase